MIVRFTAIRSFVTTALLMLSFAAMCASTARADAPAAPEVRDRAIVFPFDVLGDNAADEQWIGRAAQATLSASVSRAGVTDIETPANVAHNSDEAFKLAGERNARFVVFGSAQLVNGEVRFVGQVFDVSKNNAIAILTATGSQQDMFQLQDIMGGQVQRRLGAIVAPPPVIAPPVDTPAATADSAMALTPFQGSSLERSLGVRGSFYQRFIDTPVYERNHENQYRFYQNWGTSYPGWNGGWGWGSRGIGWGWGWGGGWRGGGWGGWGGGSNIIVVTNGNGNFSKNGGGRGRR